MNDREKELFGRILDRTEVEDDPDKMLDALFERLADVDDDTIRRVFMIVYGTDCRVTW